MVLLLALLLAGLPLAGPSDPVVTPHRAFGPRDGLPSEHVSAVAQTPDGRLWVGTLAGLAYFDGTRFHEVAFPAERGRPGITALYPQADDALWVTTSTSGTWRLAPDLTLTPAPALGETGSPRVLRRGSDTFFLGYDGAWVWPDAAAEPRALSYGYPLATPSRIRGGARGAGTGPNDVLLAPDGTILILDGVLGPGPFEPGRGATFASENEGQWWAMALDASGALWALDYERGLFLFDDALRGRLVTPLARGRRLSVRDGRAFVVTEQALVEVDLGTGAVVGRIDAGIGLPLDGLHLAFEDREDSLWLGTRNGLVQVPRPGARHLTRIGETPLINLTVTSSARGDQLWATGYRVGLIELLRGQSAVRPSGSAGWSVVERDAAGTLIAIGNPGIARLDADGVWRVVVHIPDAVRGAMGPPGTAYVWKDHGAFAYTLTDGAQTPLATWLPEDRDFHTVSAAQDGRALLRAGGVLLAVDPRGRAPADTLARLDGFERSRGRAILADPYGAVWLGFWEAGLVRVNGGRVTHSLPGEYVSHLTLLSDTLVVASTARGLFGFDARTAEAVFHLTQEDGLLSNVPTGVAIAGGSLVVTHTGGVTFLPLRALRPPSPEALRVHLTRVPLPAEPGARAASGRDVAFRFFAASYVNPSALAYEYRLGEGAWQPAEGGVLRFHRLRGGRHTLSVRGRYGSGPPGEPTALAFTVPTPYYQAGWFRALLAAALGLGLPAAYAARVRGHRRREAALERVVRERTAKLAESVCTVRLQAERLREQDALKSRFFTNVSHEFRTPLTLVLGPLRDVLHGRHGFVGEAAQHQLAVAAEHAERLAELVEELLEVSRLDAGAITLSPSPGDLVARTQAVVRAYTPAAERAGVTLVLAGAPVAYPALFDMKAVDRILGNLLSNALKHTPAGGRVEVTVVEVEGGLELTVCDTGRGIPSYLVDRVFERFVLGAEQPGSSGIGLALVRELVALHSGKAHVESAEGEGTRVTVMLPLVRHPVGGDGEVVPVPPLLAAPASTTSAAVALPPAPPPSEPVPTVLVVDDNAEIRAHLAFHLRERYRVLEACCGADALALARKAVPDAVVSDVMMPGMDGEELCRQLRGDPTLADIPVLLLTARAGGPAAAEGYRAGADAYVTKPFDAEALLAQLDRLLARRVAAPKTVVLDGLGVAFESADEELLRAVFEVIEAQAELSVFGVEELAAEVGVSPRHLRRRLREATGETPAELLRRYRLERAARLLVAGAGNVAQVAARVGYTKASAFASQFHRRFGVSPSEYARGARGGSESGVAGKD